MTSTIVTAAWRSLSFQRHGLSCFATNQRRCRHFRSLRMRKLRLHFHVYYCLERAIHWLADVIPVQPKEHHFRSSRLSRSYARWRWVTWFTWPFPLSPFCRYAAVAVLSSSCRCLVFVQSLYCFCWSLSCLLSVLCRYFVSVLFLSCLCVVLVLSLCCSCPVSVLFFPVSVLFLCCLCVVLVLSLCCSCPVSVLSFPVSVLFLCCLCVVRVLSPAVGSCERRNESPIRLVHRA